MALLRTLCSAIRFERLWARDTASARSPAGASRRAPTLLALHCNHRTRPLTNPNDEKTVVEACLAWGVDVRIARAPAFAGGNFQNAAREWRYAEAERLRAQWYAQTGGQAFVVTAHHARDVAETMLLHLARGCGPEGLSGLAPIDLPRRILRPFAQVPHADIRRYAEERRVPWQEDPTNADTTYARNWIRHTVLPALEKLNPSFEQAFVRCSRDIRTLTHHRRPPLTSAKEQTPTEDASIHAFAPLRASETTASDVAAACRDTLRQTKIAPFLRVLTQAHWNNLAFHVSKARSSGPLIVSLPDGLKAACFASGIAFHVPPPKGSESPLRG